MYIYLIFSSEGTEKLIYSGADLEFIDLDSELLPYTVYEYMITAYNSVGHVTSMWANQRTLPAPPLQVPQPLVHDDVSQRSVCFLSSWKCNIGTCFLQ